MSYRNYFRTQTSISCDSPKNNLFPDFPFIIEGCVLVLWPSVSFSRHVEWHWIDGCRAAWMVGSSPWMAGAAAVRAAEGSERGRSYLVEHSDVWVDPSFFFVKIYLPNKWHRFIIYIYIRAMVHDRFTLQHFILLHTSAAWYRTTVRLQQLWNIIMRDRLGSSKDVNLQSYDTPMTFTCSRLWQLYLGRCSLSLAKIMDVRTISYRYKWPLRGCKCTCIQHDVVSSSWTVRTTQSLGRSALQVGLRDSNNIVKIRYPRVTRAHIATAL
jgi:hypothetical protein